MSKVLNAEWVSQFKTHVEALTTLMKEAMTEARSCDQSEYMRSPADRLRKYSLFCDGSLAVRNLNGVLDLFKSSDEELYRTCGSREKCDAVASMLMLDFAMSHKSELNLPQEDGAELEILMLLRAAMSDAPHQVPTNRKSKRGVSSRQEKDIMDMLREAGF